MVQANHTSSEQYSPSSQLPSKYTRFTPLWRWYKAGDPRYFWTEYIKSHSEDISLTWFDIGEPLLIHSQPNQIPNRRYGVCTVLIPALGTRLVRNGIEAKGQSWPREREGRPFSTSALAFSESWTDAI